MLEEPEADRERRKIDKHSTHVFQHRGREQNFLPEHSADVPDNLTQCC